MSNKKMKVQELASKLGISNDEVISKLKSAGIEVKSSSSAINDNDLAQAYSVLKDDNDSNSKATNTKPSKESNIHIIRRQVKVIKTDTAGNQVEQITTKAHGEIKQETIKQNNNRNNAISNTNNKRRDDDVVPNSNRNTSNNFNYQNRANGNNNFGNNRMLNRRNVNVIVTKGGKPINDLAQAIQNKEEIKNNIEEVTKIEKVETKKIENNNQNNNNSNNSNFGNNQFRRDNRDNNNYVRRDDNRQQGGYNNYNNSNNGNFGNNQFRRDNRDNNNYVRRDDNRQQGRYNNNSNNGNFGNNQFRRDNSGNRDNNSYVRRDDNRTPGGYNNSNNGGYRRFNRNDNPQSSINNMIKKVTEVVEKDKLELKPKENRNIIGRDKDKDKQRQSHVDTINKNKKDRNKINEENTRIASNMFRGISVGSEDRLLDLYERGSDLAKRGYSKRKKDKSDMQTTKIIPLTEINIPEILTVGEFATAMKKTSGEVIKKLFGLGIMATVNQDIDFDTAFLIAEEFGITAIRQENITEEDILFDDTEDMEENLVKRAPIVVVMGHVDHGKTSLLDAVRKTSVVSGEAGGITQHIGAYKVKVQDREITFLDTPGHEAFTQMRARGAQVTDIAILVVAADDGIMPQTIEAINHAKAAGVNIIIAINKIDKPEANIDRVKQELMEHGLVSEEWGGDTICCPISAKTGQGLDNLLEMVLLVADMKELRVNPNKQAKGTILEAKMDKTKGTLVSVLVQRGTLNTGDTIVVGEVIGKVRAMADDKGNKIDKAGPSTPVEILGLPTVPSIGEVFYEVENEKVAKQLVEKRKANIRRELIKETSKVTLDDLFNQIKEGQLKDLNVIVKADVQGSLEALKQCLEKLSNDEVRVRIIHSAVGNIVESDVTLASVSKAIIIGFNVKVESSAKSIADKEKVDLRLYKVIYDAINDVESAMKGMLAPKYNEVSQGSAKVLQVFKLSSHGTIAGCKVTDGKIVRNGKVRVLRDGAVIFEGDIDSIKREKDDVKEAKEGYECGIKIEKFNDIKEDDVIECYIMEEVKR